MPMQEVTVRVNVPEGWEITGEYRLPRIGDNFIASTGRQTQCASDFDHEHKVIIRRIEPLAIRACRRFVEMSTSHTACEGSPIDLARQAVADYEASIQGERS